MRKSAEVFAACLLAVVLLAGGIFTGQGEAGAKGEVEIDLDPNGSSTSGAGVEIDGSQIAIYSACAGRSRRGSSWWRRASGTR